MNTKFNLLPYAGNVSSPVIKVEDTSHFKQKQVTKFNNFVDKKFHDLKQFFIKDLESFPENKDIYTDWLFKEFGHKKGKILNEIIYNKIYPNKD